MKKLVMVFVTVCITVSGFAQKTADIGIWGGTSTYFGDLDDTPPFQSFNPNFGAYFRYNFNARVGARFMFMTGNAAAEGNIEGEQWAFDKSIQDVSLMVEINYLRFISGLTSTRFSPYIMGGIGVSYLPYNLDPSLIYSFNPQHNKGTTVKEESVISPTIPFGFGAKYNLGKRVGIGIEYQMRKLFNDKVDDLDDPLAFIDTEGTEITYTSNVHNNDWVGYLGVHIVYKIYIGKSVCPAYNSRNW